MLTPTSAAQAPHIPAAARSAASCSGTYVAKRDDCAPHTSTCAAPRERSAAPRSTPPGSVTYAPRLRSPTRLTRCPTASPRVCAVDSFAKHDEPAGATTPMIRTRAVLVVLPLFTRASTVSPLKTCVTVPVVFGAALFDAVAVTVATPARARRRAIERIRRTR